MRSGDEKAILSPPSSVGLVMALLAITAFFTVAAGVRATEARASQVNAGLEAEYYADEADAEFFDFRDDEFGDSTAFGNDDFGDVGFGSNDEIGGGEGFVDVEDDMFNFDAEHGQDYDEQLISDETDDEYQQDINAFETDEAWFEDWFDDEE